MSAPPALPLDPAYAPYLRLLDHALAAADGPAWDAMVPAPGDDPEMPLLHGATLRVDAVRLAALVDELLAIAADGAPPPSVDALALVRDAIVEDHGAIARAARDAGVDAGALGVVAQMAARPLLAACARAWRGRVPGAWVRGDCPVCGAWPALAEVRGLERSRRMRCGRCGGDWALPVLRCPYCDEVRHDRLAALLPEGEEQLRRVEVCVSCNGYVKSFAVLGAMPLRALAERDLASVDLDLVAAERGFVRPARRAGMTVAVAAAP